MDSPISSKNLSANPEPAGSRPVSEPAGSRRAIVARRTNETELHVEIDLDGTGKSSCNTSIGFLDHMLEQLARHSLIDMDIRAKGDTHIDDHHSVEDTGIALGQALKQALGEKRGIVRYGSSLLVMDDALSQVALDLSNRPCLVWAVDIKPEKIGQFDTELVREFFQAFVYNAGISLHAERIRGFNAHHIVESLFKATACALRMAIEIDRRRRDALPTTKGLL